MRRRKRSGTLFTRIVPVSGAVRAKREFMKLPNEPEILITPTRFVSFRQIIEDAKLTKRERNTAVEKKSRSCYFVGILRAYRATRQIIIFDINILAGELSDTRDFYDLVLQ